ncbi:PLP-dependent aminotransferase family protein [Aquincola sp. S2]|uniref:PLP-dependent aminotransferase family protein n=1 Tax=Pseudaquabacterium terrae TaxID=2732868 RepID=A0ABX2EKP0_9BURK|nr:PLP-dependent aminotransferase family protein [Aquabacterium terrae]NRF69214.1 PLP-dependent aminotransferase family protein [Aquabacterium terrae]
MRPARYHAIVDELAARIHSGELRPGDRLPTIRALMQSHGVALATASRAMGELAAAGLVVGETGRGTFVRDASLPRGSGLEHHPAGFGAIDLSLSYPTLPGQDQMLREGLRGIAASGDLDALLHSAPQGGRPHERQTMARHLRNRGIRLPPEQVLIVAGAQHGLAVTLMALLKPGDVLAVDALSYPGLLALARAQRLDILALPQAGGQTDLDALARLCKRRPVRAIYTMPTLHNPLGSVMPADDRIRLARLAEQHELMIIEDGTYAFLGEPAPAPVITLAPQRTVYVSGLSKSVAAGLRVGYVAAPLALMPALERAIRISTSQTASVTTALACVWIESGQVDALEDAKRADARRRQALARRALRGCTVVAHPMSYYLWLPLSGGQRADRIAAALEADGVLLTTAEPFAATTHVPQAVRVALGSVAPEALARALEIIRAAVTA